MQDYAIVTTMQPMIAARISSAVKAGSNLQKLWDTPVFDGVSEARILKLHPSIQGYARFFVNAVKQELGLTLRLVSGLRTWKEQDDLYELGRKKDSSGKIIGKIVTYAKGGQSNHNFGLAFDVVPLIGGIPAWETTEWSQIADIGKKIGFEWGGDWSPKKKDRPHFQMLFGKTLVQLQALFESGKREGDYVTLV